MNLSIALNDLRIAGKHAVRDEQAEHQRFCFRSDLQDRGLRPRITPVSGALGSH
jgi:hypothetical protein